MANQTAKQILPDVYWIEGKGSNFYLFIHEQGLGLVDCGNPNQSALLQTAIAEVGCKPADLTAILLTHADIDHIGSLAAMQQATGATVYAGAQTAAFVQAGTHPKHLPGPIQWIVEQFMRYDPLTNAPIEIISDGQVLPFLGGLKALATPGHTVDHFSFYSKTMGILFAGDALQTRGDVIRRMPKLISANDDDVKASGIKLLTLAPAVIACGHGPPKSDHSSEDLMALLNKLRQS